MTRKQKILVIVGPTASGKSDLAIRLAKKYGGEIISADSRQVYIGMDIGTGKVSKKERRIIPHYLINVISPKKQFSVDNFKTEAQKVIESIIKRNKLPIIVGGTGLYIDALIYDLDFPNVPPNKKLRAKLEKQKTEQLLKLLEKLDSRRAKTIESNNKRRLIRAIEIAKAIGKSPILNTKYHLLNTKYDVTWLGLSPKDLPKRIKLRLDKRLRQGMLREVKRLKKSGLSWKRLESFGLEYRWIAKYLQNEINYKKMKEGLYHDIVKYSKRQITWFKRNPRIRWITSSKRMPSI